MNPPSNPPSAHAPARSSNRPTSTSSYTSAGARGTTFSAAGSSVQDLPPPSLALRSRTPTAITTSIRSSAATSAAGSGTRSPRNPPASLVQDEILPPNPPFAATRSRSNSHNTQGNDRVSRSSSPAPPQHHKCATSTHIQNPLSCRTSSRLVSYPESPTYSDNRLAISNTPGSDDKLRPTIAD